ncbi:hypothetical protein ACFY7C_19635 [Streptomyces sp. NPDC012769]|uniref:hypothetical protein n=1 Tax=Streptomyces sp. NPDC012769 TaxID=3364848 RepID=UPI0036BB0B84
MQLSDFKAYLVGRENANLTGQDANLIDALNSASREIESHCRRQFNDAGSVTAREFRPDMARSARVDDFSTTAGLVVKLDTNLDGTFATTLTSAQYELSPANGIVDGVPGWPYCRIRLTDNSISFPYSASSGRERVLQVTARWGWTEVPEPVRAACRIMAAETWKLKDAPLGVSGLDEFGAVIRVRQNKLAASKLAPYARRLLLD